MEAFLSSDPTFPLCVDAFCKREGFRNLDSSDPIANHDTYPDHSCGGCGGSDSTPAQDVDPSNTLAGGYINNSCSAEKDVNWTGLYNPQSIQSTVPQLFHQSQLAPTNRKRGTLPS
ncbi:unnamed protein product, partial [Protopolystoma xenopodis]